MTDKFIKSLKFTLTFFALVAWAFIGLFLLGYAFENPTIAFTLSGIWIFITFFSIHYTTQD